MRLKIEITRRLLGDARKDGPGDQAAIIQLRLRGVRVVQHNESNELRMIGRQITRERNDIFPVFVSAFGIHFLRGAGLARDGETGNRRRGSRALDRSRRRARRFRSAPLFPVK